MNKDLELIKEIQSIDAQIVENQKRLVMAPRKKEELEKELKELYERADREKRIIEELERERRKKERDLDAEREKIKRHESRLFEVKTNKEYQALLKEIEMAKETTDKMEEDVLVLLERIEELRKDHQLTMEHLRTREKEIEMEKKRLEQELSTMDEAMKELQARKKSLLREIPEELKNTYALLLERRGGVAVANVKEGVCLGCHINLPPQLFIEVSKKEEILTCPNCSRILYYVEE